MPKVGIISLGCVKNTIDSEVMINILQKQGLQITNNENEADILLVNTCSFIKEAEEESFKEIKKVLATGKEIIVAGCLVQKFKDELTKKFPQIKHFIGVNEINKIGKIVQSTEHIIQNTGKNNYELRITNYELNNERETISNEQIYSTKPSKNNLLISKVSAQDKEISPEIYSQRTLSTPHYTAYIKIAEGCNHKCTFCIIPQLRGKYRSRKIKDIVTEAKKLADRGVKELILISQDSSYYGKDIYNDFALANLINQLVKISSLKWLRILYLFPTHITKELIAYFNHPKICNYLDIPLQHCSLKILSLMGRKQTLKKFIWTVENARKIDLNFAIRSSFIVGFPQETKKDFNELLNFVKKIKFTHLGVFTYSKENNTFSAKLKNQISEKVKNIRKNTLMKLQQNISKKIKENTVGKVFEVLVEGKKDNLYFGRSQYEAPEVDGKIFFTSTKNLKTGEFVKVKITSAKVYDLIGTYNG